MTQAIMLSITTNLGSGDSEVLILKEGYTLARGHKRNISELTVIVVAKTF